MERYKTLNSYLREHFGGKLYKLALDGGFTCPNRDGTLGTRSCIFCSALGSGDFAEPVGDDVYAAIERAKRRVAHKNPGGKYIAYFQSFTSTYAPLPRLEALFTETLSHPDIAALSIATRPDCLDGGKLALLSRLNEEKPVWVELGLQTVHEPTARYIRRGYETSVYYDAVERLKVAGLVVIAHMIIGLPGENADMIYETARRIGSSGADGVKFQLLHVLEGTDLAADYLAGKFRLPDRDEYIRLLAGCIERIPPAMVVHRLTGDGAKRELIAPLWSGDKKRVLQAVRLYFDEHDILQGKFYEPDAAP